MTKLLEQQIRGLAYVVGDDIDTDVIIPAQHLHLSHTNPQQKTELGRHAFEGLPDEKAGLPKGSVPFVEPGQDASKFSIVVAGNNFGCGSSRAQAPGALNAAGVKAVVANYYARIFYRNVVNAGLLMPVETGERLCEQVRTGDELEIRLKDRVVINHTQRAKYPIRDLGAIAEILEAGDVFAYARQKMHVQGSERAKRVEGKPAPANNSVTHWTQKD